MKNKEFKQLQKGFKLAFKMLDKIIEAKKIHVEELKLLEKPLASKLPAVGINKKYPDGGDTAVGIKNSGAKFDEMKKVALALSGCFNHDDAVVKRELERQSFREQYINDVKKVIGEKSFIDQATAILAIPERYWHQVIYSLNQATTIERCIELFK